MTKRRSLTTDVGSVWEVPLDPPPDLSLPPEIATDLEVRIRQHLHRWLWRQEPPAAVRRELYELITWLLQVDRHGVPPPAPPSPFDEA